MVLFTEKNSIQETAHSPLQDQRCLGFPAKSHAGLNQRGMKVNYIIFQQLVRGRRFSNWVEKWRDERCEMQPGKKEMYKHCGFVVFYMDSPRKEPFPEIHEKASSGC